MKTQNIVHVSIIGLSLVTATILGIVFAIPSPKIPGNDPLHYPTVPPEVSVHTPDRFDRAAERLHMRLIHEGKDAPSVSKLRGAIETREKLMRSEVEVMVTSLEHEPEFVTVAMKDHPSWLVLTEGLLSATFEVDEAQIAADLGKGLVEHLQPPVSASSEVTVDEFNVPRATVTRIRDGYVYDIEQVSKNLKNAFTDGMSTLVVNAEPAEGMVRLEKDGKTYDLSLISSGKSNYYDDSPENRIMNVQKAFNERLNGVVIMPGEVFSFNATLGGPVTLDKGWMEAMGLFGGGAAPTPGAGICQGATTVYRAAVLAGLPILQRRSHSLYVSHYETFGVGVDATIFPGVHDLSFRNDTESPILLQAYLEGVDAYIKMYGKPDGRVTEMEGPFFYATKGRPHAIRPLGTKEIGWLQRVTYADGRVREHALISVYAKGYPRNIVTKYADGRGLEDLKAALPSKLASN